MLITNEELSILPITKKGHKTSTFNILDTLMLAVDACVGQVRSALALDETHTIDYKIEIVGHIEERLDLTTGFRVKYKKMASKLFYVPRLTTFIKTQDHGMRAQLERKRSKIVPYAELLEYHDKNKVDDYLDALDFYDERLNIFKQALTDLKAEHRKGVEDVATNTATQLSDFGCGAD